MTTQENRLAEIRKAIEAESVSCGELSELQDIAATHPELFADDALLAEWAGIPEEDWHGPWALGIETDDTSAQVINGSGQHVCTVAIDPLPDHARLIASAPEMLEALRNVAEIMSGADYSHVKADMVRAICRRAISKAEGRAGE